MADVHEFVVLRFKDSISHDEQIANMSKLDPHIAASTASCGNTCSARAMTAGSTTSSGRRWTSRRHPKR